MKHRALILASVVLAAIGGAARWHLSADKPEGPAAVAASPFGPAGSAPADTPMPDTANPSEAAASGAARTLAAAPRGAETDPDRLQVGNNPDYPTLGSRLTEMAARRNGQGVSAAQALAAMEQRSAWRSDPSAAAELNLSPQEAADGRSFVRFDPVKLETLMPGDTLEIPVPQRNAVYHMVVEDVQAHGDGSVTWNGRLRDFPEENQATMTKGGDLVYGGFTARDELYVIQSNGTAGFIAESASLFKPTDDGHDHASGRYRMGPHTGHNPAVDPPVLP
ncbi:hypothetical protein OOT46_03445 [Aquabacterium sp. A7-Y]|uniref:hypothetical protein n=1 Tax=Aquabacterium sp. A7-Y TaxID=1349605 RepID=UPI00223DB95E|nr:hypothetical protein [Aquabacterium sp. A7-Y]MCW7536908.1 hypothetical protein [Aquabacterium sp. A7-Y]